uniref:CASP-like protein n=1 Tax=Aegilops tauschii subsp. strangulata TaxID=200361 RepID=A0A453GL19_AEGTS
MQIHSSSSSPYPHLHRDNPAADTQPAPPRPRPPSPSPSRTRKPSKEAAYKELCLHLSIMAGCIAAVRAAPYILHYLTRQPGMTELKLEL